MKIRCILRHAVACVVVSLMALSAAAQNYPTPKEGDWIARDFRFHTGEAMSELRLHFRTIVRTVRRTPCRARMTSRPVIRGMSRSRNSRSGEADSTMATVS